MTRAAIILLLLTVPAMAQVQVNPGALDALGPSASTATGKTAAKHTARPAHAAAPRHTANPAAPAAPAHPKPPAPAKLPAAPPPAPAIPPPVVVPMQHPVPPPPVPVIPDAPGEASDIPGGVRLTFGPGRSDLNPATEAALRAFAGKMKADDRLNANIAAYAAGAQDDPSTPRRLSLSRALAARAVLISEGIVSTRIYPRALGATPGTDKDAPPDRIDVTQSGGPAAPPPP